MLQATLYGPVVFALMVLLALSFALLVFSVDVLRLWLPAEMQMKASDHGTQMEEKHERIFSRWKKKYNRTYAPEEDRKRFDIFRRNYIKIKEHNSRYKSRLESFRLSANKFADISDKEFEQAALLSLLAEQELTWNQGLLGFKCVGSLSKWLRRYGNACPHRKVSLPRHVWKTGKVDFIVDHREKGAVTAVQDQVRLLPHRP